MQTSVAIAEQWAEALRVNTPLNALLAKYFSTPTQYYVGVDPSNPPSLSDTPFFALLPQASKSTVANGKQSFFVQVVCGIHYTHIITENGVSLVKGWRILGNEIFPLVWRALYDACPAELGGVEISYESTDFPLLLLVADTECSATSPIDGRRYP